LGPHLEEEVVLADGVLVLLIHCPREGRAGVLQQAELGFSIDLAVCIALSSARSLRGMIRSCRERASTKSRGSR
jgi:hypothetical protein